MITLALDTSGAASAAVLDGEEVVAQWHEPRARKHAEHLAPALRDLLAAAPPVERVIVGVGPAPFTGLRAGIAMGLGVSVGLGVPAHGWRSHDGLALRIFEREGEAVAESRLLVATDARRKEVYYSAYSGLDVHGVPVLAEGPDVARPAHLAVRLGAEPGTGAAGCLRAGRGFDLYPDVLGAPDFPGEADLEPRAADIGRAALRAEAVGRPLLPVTPLYLREPDAKPLKA